MTTTENKEIEKIKAQYVEKTPSKLDELKAVHRRVKRPAQIFGYTFGTAAALVFGTGMCLAMKVIGSSMALGIVIGVVGAGMAALTYPIYKGILAKRKKKYAAEILSLSNGLLHE